jgi:hypothetical protein
VSACEGVIENSYRRAPAEAEDHNQALPFVLFLNNAARKVHFNDFEPLDPDYTELCDANYLSSRNRPKLLRDDEFI